MRGRLLSTLFLATAVVALVLPVEAGAVAKPSVAVSHVVFPVDLGPTSASGSNYFDTTLGVLDGHVMAGSEADWYTPSTTGELSTEHTRCHVASIDPTTMRVESNRSVDCDNPIVAGQRVVPIESVERGGNTGDVRISVLDSSGGYHIGPIVMRYGNYSDTRPEWTYGGGCLWLFDAEAPKSTEVLRISESTGAVLSTVHLPWSARVLLAADDDGLWIGQGPEGGEQKGETLPLLEFVGTTATSAVNVLREPSPMTGARVDWIVGSGHKAYVAFSDVGPHAVVTIDAFSTPSGTPRQSHESPNASWSPSSIGEGPADAPPVLAAADDLFVAPDPGRDGQFDETRVNESVVGIDPLTGRIAPVTTIAGLSASSFEASAVFDGAIYLLAHAQNSSTASIYRVSLAR